jgi:hypothetical protein
MVSCEGKNLATENTEDTELWLSVSSVFSVAKL